MNAAGQWMTGFDQANAMNALRTSAADHERLAVLIESEMSKTDDPFAIWLLAKRAAEQYTLAIEFKKAQRES